MLGHYLGRLYNFNCYVYLPKHEIECLLFFRWAKKPPASHITRHITRQFHWGETGLANAGVGLSKMDAPKVGKSVVCSFEVFYHNFRASHSPNVFI